MGLFGKKDATKKYVDLFFAATKMGQSVEYALKQAIGISLEDKAYGSQAESCQALYDALVSKVEPENKPALEKAYNRLKEA